MVFSKLGKTSMMMLSPWIFSSKQEIFFRNFKGVFLYSPPSFENSLGFGSESEFSGVAILALRYQNKKDEKDFLLFFQKHFRK